MKLMKQLLGDEAGFVVSSELVLIATIAVIGMITGLATLRDGVIQELGDLAAAIGSLEQSYTFTSAIAHTAATNGSSYTDNADYCESTGNGTDTAGGAAPGCMLLSTAAGASGEGNGTVQPIP